MKKIIIALILLVNLTSCEISPPSGWYTKNINNNSNLSLELPNEFYINQNLTLWTTKLSVTDNNDNPLGYSFTKEIFSLWTNVNMYKWDSKIYSAHKKVISIWTEVEIYNSNNELIWSVEEEIIQSLFKTWTTYTIFDKDRNVIWKSKKNDFFATSFEIYNNSDKLMATIKRPAFRLLDSWGVKIEDGVNVDKALFLFIPTYKTIADSEKK